ncbi:unnamed protein product, partial [Mesorhabditis belari]|uniref:Uncharacterized protein n=1 Tax=Mesorhabditis belari TaxID=2138241 RepID=A0AAF3EQT8_9BILA
MNPNLSDHLKNTTVIPMNFDNGVPPRKKGSAFTVCPVILESQQTICSTYPHHVHFEDKVIVFVPQLDSESESDERIIEKTSE